MNDALYITGLCPYCSTALDYKEGSFAVLCTSCGATLSTADLKLLCFGEDSALLNDEDKRVAESFGSAEAALLYADEYISDYDFAAFAISNDVSIPRIEKIADSVLARFSSDPLSHILDFRRVAVPLFKKLEGLKHLALRIADCYQSAELDEAEELFKLYSSVAGAVKAYSTAAIRKMGVAITLAEGCGADSADVDGMKQSTALIKTQILSLGSYNSYEEMDLCKRIKAAKQTRISAALSAMGIDADATYAKANSLLSSGQTDNALHLMMSVYGYGDSEKIIKQHSELFTFGGELCEAAGSRYVISKGKGDSFSLYEISAAERKAEPCLSDISKIVGCFGTKIFFIRDKDKLCCFDTTSAELYANVRIIDEAQDVYEFTTPRAPIIRSSDGSAFFIRKSLSGSYGTKKKKKKKKNTSPIDTRNNFSLIRVDMDGVSASVALEAIIDVMDFYDDKIFYTTATDLGTIEFRIYDCKSGNDIQALSEDCVIHQVKDSTVIYSLWAPTADNVDLYSLDLNTLSTVLIEKNALGFFAYDEGRVYYTVGSTSNNVLYCAKADGSGARCEILQGSERVIAIRSGWIYYTSGEGRNKCLLRIRTDGARSATVASRFSKAIKITESNIYYVSTSGALRSVRVDGSGGGKIAENVLDDGIIIDENNIYYLRRDSKEDAGASLYLTDHSGKGLKKLAHGVCAITGRGKNEIYICKKHKTDFIVTTPVGKKKSKTHVQQEELREYCSYNKIDGSVKHFVTVGAPERVLVSYKTGLLFFRKRKTRASSATPMHRLPGYERSGITPAGAVYGEELSRGKRKKKNKKR